MSSFYISDFLGFGTAKKINLKIIKDTTKHWEFPGTGVMGLSPTSAFAKYLLPLNHAPISVALKFDSKKFKSGNSNQLR